MSFESPILICDVAPRSNQASRRELVNRIVEQRPKVLFITEIAGSSSPSLSAELTSRLSWDCDVQIKEFEGHPSFRSLMNESIDWAFRFSDELVVLEGDCIPDSQFFSYSASLLERYREEDDVMMISGNNFQPSSSSLNGYYFSKYANTVGWATWRNAWRNMHDPEMHDWPNLPDSEWLSEICEDPAEKRFWAERFQKQFDSQVDTWEIAWQYSIWRAAGLVALPNRSLVNKQQHTENFPAATDQPAPRKLAAASGHRFDQSNNDRALAAWTHPRNISTNKSLDKFIWKNVVCGLSFESNFTDQHGKNCEASNYLDEQLSLFKKTGEAA